MTSLGICLKVPAYQGKELNEVMSGVKMRNHPKPQLTSGVSLPNYCPFYSLLLPKCAPYDTFTILKRIDVIHATLK